MMRKVYKVWRNTHVTASLSDSESAGRGDFARFEDVRIPVRELVTDIASCSLEAAEDAIDADIKRRADMGDFGRITDDKTGKPVMAMPKGDRLARVQAEYAVTEEFVKG